MFIARTSAQLVGKEATCPTKYLKYSLYLLELEEAVPALIFTSVASVPSEAFGIFVEASYVIFAWKFARKGYAFVKNALSGKAGKV